MDTEFYPELSVISIDTFYKDCIKLGVKFLILNADAVRVASFLDKLHGEALKDNRFVCIRQSDTTKIFKVTTP